MRTATAATPFLKWAGGKRQLLPGLRRFVPATFTAYTEAFPGSGALFFDLAAQGRLDPVTATLIDRNADLVGVYAARAREPARVIDWLHELSRRHADGAADHYCKVRGERFNPARRRLRARGTPAALHRASRGRVSRPQSHVLQRPLLLERARRVQRARRPLRSPNSCDERKLMRVAALLGQPNVFIFRDTFERLRRTAEPGEFIYFDPPYAPVSPTASFRSYTAEGFRIRIRCVCNSS